MISRYTKYDIRDTALPGLVLYLRFSLGRALLTLAAWVCPIADEVVQRGMYEALRAAVRETGE